MKYEPFQIDEPFYRMTSNRISNLSLHLKRKQPSIPYALRVAVQMK